VQPGTAETDADADPRTGPRATTHAAAATTAASPRTIAATAASRRARSAQRTLARDDELGRDRLEVERIADERPERNDELGDLDAASGDHLVGGAHREPHLFLGAEQDDVGERSLDRIAHTPAAIAVRSVVHGVVLRRRSSRRRGTRAQVA